MRSIVDGLAAPPRHDPRRAWRSFSNAACRRRPGSLEHALIVGAAQILFHGRARSRGRRSRRARRARRPEGRALRRARQRRAAQHRPRARRICADPPIRFVDTPPWLAARWRRTGRRDRDAPSRSCTATSRRSTSPCAATPAGWAERLGGIVLPTGSVRLVNRRRRSPNLPAMPRAQWWVQDAAAAIPARLLRVAPGERVADLCAAPGGKTAQLAAAGAAGRRRSTARPNGMKRLAANLERLGLPAEIAVGDAPDLRRAAVRRHPARCALHGDRHDPPPSRRRLDQDARRHRSGSSAMQAGCSIAPARC